VETNGLNEDRPPLIMARQGNNTNGNTANIGFEATTRRLAVMNLALRGIETDLGPPAGARPNTFRRDLHPDLRADTATRVSANPQPQNHLAGLLRSERRLLANPPFNDSDWFRKDDDPSLRDWQFGVPPRGICGENHRILSNWSNN
jgi:type I restriction-modification system DNA methylase subunit